MSGCSIVRNVCRYGGGVLIQSSAATMVMDACSLYRVYNPNALEAGAHHYTADVDERDYLVVVGWSAEGIGWYGMDEEKAMELMKQAS